MSCGPRTKCASACAIQRRAARCSAARYLITAAPRLQGCTLRGAPRQRRRYKFCVWLEANTTATVEHTLIGSHIQQALRVRVNRRYTARTP